MQEIWREFDSAFGVMETNGKAKILANSSVITVDGMTADIYLTEDYPYISGAGPRLQLTPKVGRDEYITVDASIKTGSVLETITGSGAPPIRTSNRRATTYVRVQNGEPFVIGGLFREDLTTNSVTRIPVLERLPLLDEIFSYRLKGNDESQVVILVVPFILDMPEAAPEVEKVPRSQR
jgi:type IV pilus assembly protein PilQ